MSQENDKNSQDSTPPANTSDGQKPGSQYNNKRDRYRKNPGFQKKFNKNIKPAQGTENQKPEIKKKADPAPETREKPRPINQQSNLSSISVIIPLFNEEDSLPELSLMLDAELKKAANNRWEVIFIDDGSTDKSWQVLKQIHNRNPKFKAIRFRRNQGKSAALHTGFQEARGSIVITMDADLQDDPAEIHNLIAKLGEGFDLVSGWKKKRRDPINKTLPSKLFNKVTSIMSGLKLHDFNCGLKAYRRDVVKTVQVYGEMHRYIPALAHWEGFRVTEIPVTHHPRRYGKTKFGFSRYIKGFLDLLTVMFTTRYFKRPLHFFGTFGSIFVLIGLATDIYLTVEWALGKTALSNRPLALLGIALIIVGVQFMSMGLIGELITKSSLKNASYSIRDRL